MSQTTDAAPAPRRAQRELTIAEQAILDEIEVLGSQLMRLTLSLEPRNDVNKRDLAIARTNLQTGLMWLERSIEKSARF